ncbi:MAG: YicC family protein [Defluviitaleaceae bacterium]|nr:YicC family protein [Defluviitaleaceae bacterium]
MIKSMTGYGRGECILWDWKCTVEIKAVNHRYCDITIRIPHMMNPYEDRVRKMLAKDIRRGKVDVYIRLDSLGQHPIKMDVNFALVDAYFKALNKVLERYIVPDQVTLSMLTSNPDVFMTDNTVTDETKKQVWQVMEKAVAAAISQFNDMRMNEGYSMYEDIMEKCSHIKELLTEIKTRVPISAQDYKKRLTDRINEVFTQMPKVELDESRLLMELAIYADKVNIDEELTRLDSHLEQFYHIMTEDDAVGRKLDFLVQELHREVNTIGSKTGDITTSKLVIDMKSEIEKIREQVQNVE